MTTRNASLVEKMAAAAARMLGLTPAQADAYRAACLAAPAILPNGKPVPLHAIGMEAARAAGYVGGDHPAGY